MMKPIGSNSLKSLMHTQTGLSTLELSLWVSQFLAHSKPIRHQDNRHQRKFLIRRATVFRRVLNGTSYALWKKERWKGCVFVRGVSVRSLWKLSEKKREGRLQWYGWRMERGFRHCSSKNKILFFFENLIFLKELKKMLDLQKWMIRAFRWFESSKNLCKTQLLRKLTLTT
jgi:hypothetical protein